MLAQLYLGKPQTFMEFSVVRASTDYYSEIANLSVEGGQPPAVWLRDTGT